jgi:nucleoside-diphosphate-sugar epimerase
MKNIRVLVTGGAGDLGSLLIPTLVQQGCSVRVLDLAAPLAENVEYISGSIVDRKLVQKAVEEVDLIIHIAAWHGYHEFTCSKSDAEFFDVNMTGTFNLLDACQQSGCKKFLFISSTSVDEWPGIYGMTKQLGEDMVRGYAQRFEMQSLSLRPRAFIPWWNKQVYNSYLEWARWFSGGAVYIGDVKQAVQLGAEFLVEKDGKFYDSIEIDGRHDFSEMEKSQWRQEGAEAFLSMKFGKLFATAREADFLPESPPSYKDLQPARELLNYVPTFGYAEMLEGFSQQTSTPV